MRIAVVYCTIGFAFTQFGQRRQVDIIVPLHTIVDGQLNGLHCGGSSLGNGAVVSSEISIVQQIVFCCSCLVQCYFAGNDLFVPHLGIFKSSRDSVIRCGEVVLALQPVKGRRHRCVGGSVILLFDFAWNADGQFRRDDFPLCCGSSGVVAGTFDRQGDSVAGIGGLAATFDVIGDSCFIPVLQRHAGDLRRLLLRIVREFVFFQRDSCALDGLGGDGNFYDAGYGLVFLVAFSRGEYPSDVVIAGLAGFIVWIRPRKGALDLFSCVEVFHLARNFALAQCVTVGNLACGDFADRRGLDLVHCADIDSQSDVLIVCALDHYGHCAHRAGGFHVVFLNGQGQLAIFHLRAAGVVAVI